MPKGMTRQGAVGAWMLATWVVSLLVVLLVPTDRLVWLSGIAWLYLVFGGVFCIPVLVGLFSALRPPMETESREAMSIATESESSAINNALWVAALVSLLATVGLLGWQSYQFLMVGVWPSMSVVNALVLWFESPWAMEPRTWIGVWKILDWMPLGAFGVGVTLALVGLATKEV